MKEKKVEKEYLELSVEDAVKHCHNLGVYDNDVVIKGLEEQLKDTRNNWLRLRPDGIDLIISNQSFEEIKKKFKHWVCSWVKINRL